MLKNQTKRTSILAILITCLSISGCATTSVQPKSSEVSVTTTSIADTSSNVITSAVSSSATTENSLVTTEIPETAQISVQSDFEYDNPADYGYTTYAEMQVFSTKDILNTAWINDKTSELWYFFSDGTLVRAKDSFTALNTLEPVSFKYTKGDNQFIEFSKNKYSITWQDDKISLVPESGDEIDLTFSCTVDKLSNYVQSNLLNNNYTPMFWKVVDKHTNNTVYLLGTFHMLDYTTNSLNKRVKDCIDNECDACYFEVTLADVLAHPDAEDIMYYTADDSLRKHMPTADYVEFKKEFENIHGYYPDILDTVKLQELPNTLSMLGSQCIMDLDFAGGGMDTMLEDYCIDKGIPVHSIEDVYAHYASLVIDDVDDLSIELLFSTLDSLKDIHDYTESLAELYEAYLSGDYEVIASNMTTTEGVQPELMEQFNRYLDALLYDRNDAMTSKIVEQLADSDTEFFVVGSAHYGGERGIISELTRLGYTVEFLG